MKTTKDGIGLGLMKLPFNNKEVYGHGGGIDGFSSIAVHFPKEEITAAYIANTSDYPMNGLFQGAVKIILGMEYDLPNFSPVKTLKLEGLEKYTGIYSGPGFPVEITISNKGNVLSAQATGQPSVSLDAVSENIFKADEILLKLTFLPKENKMLIEQGGKKA